MDEAAFLKGYAATAHPPLSVTVDLVLMSVIGGMPVVLLTRRAAHPFKGRWTLPGGFVAPDESLDRAARRVLADKARLEHVYMEQLYSFGAVDRDPRMRIVSVAYFALLPAERLIGAQRAGPDLALGRIAVPWSGESGGPVAIEVDGEGGVVPGFDHGRMIALAMLRLRGKLDYAAIAFALLPERFTLRALQDVYEAILGTRLNKPAFRRRMTDRGWLEPTGERETGTSFRPAELYRHRAPNPNAG